MSTNPIAYITPLTDELAKQFGKKKTSAWTRPNDVLRKSVEVWIHKKFLSPGKAKAREKAWPNLPWKYYFVHGKVKHLEEIEIIRSCGIEIICFYDILKSLCNKSEGGARGAAGTDIAEMIAYYESFRHVSA